MSSPPPEQRDGTTWRLPRSRRLVDDLLAHSQSVPKISQVRKCHLPRLAAARAEAADKVCWPALFMKAYANVCVRRPELRRLLLRWPWLRLYQHPSTVCRMTVAREVDGEAAVMLSRTLSPEEVSLSQIHQDVCAIARGPMEEQQLLMRQQKFSRVPTLLRRLCWKVVANVSGPLRAYWLGTFLVTSVSKFGGMALTTPVISNATLSFGPVDEDGHVDVVLVYDHRIYDGAVTAQALADLEAELDGPICDELKAMQATTDVQTATAAA